MTPKRLNPSMLCLLLSVVAVDGAYSASAAEPPKSANIFAGAIANQILHENDAAHSAVALPAPPPVDGKAVGVADPAGASQTGTDPATGEAAAVEAKPIKFSYGDSNLSILFLPTQMDKMRAAIRTFETINKEAKPLVVAPQPEVQPEVVKISEPSSYPVFYLASIAYNAPDDWSVWVSGHKITSHKNETDLSILDVSKESATFLWKPDFAEAVAHRKAEKAFASTEPMKHKLSQTQPVSLSPADGVVTFTLRLNQSFSVGYFSIFEGYVDAPALQVITLEKDKANANSEVSALGNGVPNIPPGATGAPSLPPRAGVPAGVPPQSQPPLR